MPKIDTRFLSTHPATKRWFERRQKCDACARMIQPEGSPAMLCGAITGRPYCIDASDEGGECGPQAAKFEPLA